MPARLPEPCHHTDSGALPRIAAPVQYIVHDALLRMIGRSS